MFHVKHIWIFLVLCPLFARSQAYFKLEDKNFTPYVPVDSSILKHVERELSRKPFTEQEKQFFYWSCFLRKNPDRFLKEIIIPFTATFPEVNGKEAESLKSDLRGIGSLALFSSQPVLREMAIEHALDLSGSNKISHNSSDGRGFSARIQSFGFRKCASENIYTGKNDGLLALIMLLLDIGLENPGHRKNILNPNHVAMGVSIKPHQKEQRIVLVQILGCN